MNFLVACGAIIFTGNALTTAFLFARAQAAADGIRGVHAAVQAAKKQQQQAWEAQASADVAQTPKARTAEDDLEGARVPNPKARSTQTRVGFELAHESTVVRRLSSAALLVALPIALLQLTCLGTGFAQNELAAAARHKAMHLGNASADLEAGLAARMRHDVLHGSWHILISIAINTAGHSLVMGLSGRLDQPEMINHWGELAAGATGWLLAIVNLVLSLCDAGPWPILLTYLAVTSVCTPLLTVALCKQVALHNELVTSAVPLSKRSYSLPGLRLPRWSTKDWHPMAIYHSVIWSPQKELGVVELWPPPRRGHQRETPSALRPTRCDAGDDGVSPWHGVANLKFTPTPSAFVADSTLRQQKECAATALVGAPSDDSTPSATPREVEVEEAVSPDVELGLVGTPKKLSPGAAKEGPA